MTSTFQVILVHGDADYAARAAHAAFERVDAIAAQLSRHREGSDVARVNRLRPGELVRVAPDVFDCLRAADDLGRRTHGAFDVLGIGGSNALVELIEAEVAVRLVEGRADLDLGGIGKGWVVDRVAALLRDEWEIDDFLVHAGHSSVRALGSAPGRTGWPCRLRVPGAARPPLCVCSLEDRAAGASGTATRGDHVRDPRAASGEPRQAATWAFAPTATEADALATAFMVMAPASVEDLCRREPAVGAILVAGQPDGGTPRILGAVPEELRS